MIIKVLEEICRRVGRAYSWLREKAVAGRVGKIGKSSRICYPFTISHKELIEIGDHTTILENARMQVCPERTEEKGHIKIGSNCFVGYRFCILAGADVTIGNDVTMASNVCIVSENHGIDPESDICYGKQPLQTAPVKIGDGCWLGESVMIMPGVQVGEKSVIGGGAVVTKSIPAYSIAVGNPARVVKKYDFETHKWIKI